MNKATTKGFTQRHNQRLTAILIAALFCAIALLSAVGAAGAGLFSRTAHAAGDVQSGKTTYNAVGGGTEQSPYLIGNAKQLRDLAATANAGNPLEGVYIKMTADIDLSDYGDTFNGGEGWDPIGNGYGGYFAGNFDGGGYEVQNLYINAKTSHDVIDMGVIIAVALFGMMDKGSIKNLGVNGEVSATGDADAQYVLAAGIACAILSTTETEHDSGDDENILFNITNCYNAATISVSGATAGGMSIYGGLSDAYLKVYFVAGIVAMANYSNITNCYNTGTVNVVSGSQISAAGIVATGDENVVENCFNMGSITADASLVGAAAVGGIISSGKTSAVNCYNRGSVSATGGDETCAGGIGGMVNGPDKIYNGCYNRGSVSATGGEAVAGGIMGYLYMYGTIASDCFYDKTVFTGDAIGRYPVLGEYHELLPGAGLSTAQMTAQNALEVGAMSVLQNAFARRFGPDGTYYPELKVFLDYVNPINQVNQDIIREASKASASVAALVYTIIYENVNGATNDNAVEYTQGVPLELKDLGARSGFVFGGWYNNEQLAGRAIKSIAAGSFGDKTFYAKWTSSGGGSWIIWLIIAAVVIAAGTVLALIIIKNKKGNPRWQGLGQGRGAQPVRQQRRNSNSQAYQIRTRSNSSQALILGSRSRTLMRRNKARILMRKNPYAPQQPQQNPYAQNPYGQSNPYAQNPYTQQPSQPNPYAANPYSQPQQPQQGQNPYGQQYSNPYKPYNPYDPYDKNR